MILDVFTAAGVHKNHDLDCWVFSMNDEKKKSEELSEDSHDESSPHPSKKKKRKSKKKNSKQHVKKVVHWGQVKEVLFTRALSHDVIPSNGGFPLGLGEFTGEYCFSLTATQQDNRPRRRAGTTGKIELEEVTISVAPTPIAENLRSKMLLNQQHKVENATEINKEIKSIRESRQGIGCSCKPLKVDKLNVNKLKSEIRKRCPVENKDEIESLKKADLVRILRDLLKTTRLCVDADCECVHSEIVCSPLVCGCACSTHRVQEEDNIVSDDKTSIEGDEKESNDLCGNPFGKDNFDFEKVQHYRRQILQSQLTK